LDVIANLDEPTSPSYGIILPRRLAWLESLIPNGSAIEIGLLTELPDISGVGGVELSGSGYASVVCTGWESRVLDSTRIERRTTVDVRFPTLTSAVEVIGWQMLDPLGVMIAFGRLRTEGGTPRAVQFNASDTPIFASGDLRVIV
jgi:hypothetical protein